MSVEPFKVEIPSAVINNLRERLANARLPDEVAGANWDYGTNLSYLKNLCSYWQNEFDWRKQEQAINKFAHFRAEVDGFKIHFIHERSQSNRALPLVALHGFPSSFLQMQKIIPLLTNSANQNGGTADSFDVIVPSLPGYGFSDRPREKGWNVARMAKLFHKLLVEELGYERYAIRASDLGAGVAKEMALAFPKQVVALHLSGSNPYVYQTPTDLSEAERQFVQKVQQWMQTEGAYAAVQSTKPNTLAFGLNDSPIGLAAWIVEKFRAWSDCDGDVERRFSKDELLTNLTIYWATETISSAVRLYYESARVPSPNAGKRVETSTAFVMPTKDISVAPREWEERTYNVVRWTELPRGGHFAEWEEPELIAQDVREFFRQFR